jgi:CheY-like chemotaxis protein
MISVSDSGIGISADKQDKIFRPFDQADNTIARDYGGTGLGLSISSRLIEMMGSRINLRSMAEVGSVFFFTLTLPRQKPAELSAQEAQARAVPRERPVHILLVEDNPVNRKLALIMLERMGHSCEVAVDGLEAVAKFAAGDFDLILMDCQMPKLDGYGATERIRALGGYGSRIPIIALTANAMDSERQRCLGVGMNDFVTKPIDREELRRKILEYADRKKQP